MPAGMSPTDPEAKNMCARRRRLGPALQVIAVSKCRARSAKCLSSEVSRFGAPILYAISARLTIPSTVFVLSLKQSKQSQGLGIYIYIDLQEKQTVTLHIMHTLGWFQGSRFLSIVPWSVWVWSEFFSRFLLEPHKWSCHLALSPGGVGPVGPV